jgi:chlorophyll(ide) b reductase
LLCPPPPRINNNERPAGADTPIAKFFINCLAEKAEDVAAYLVPLVRAVPREPPVPVLGGHRSAYIRFLTRPKALAQILARVFTGQRKDLHVKEG